MMSKRLLEKWLGRSASGPRVAQLELPIDRERTPDRNADKGGRSFYFFDFDDNVAFLSTPILIFHKVTGAELKLTSGEFAQVHRKVGKEGPYADYRIDLNDQTGTFQNFRDREFGLVHRLLRKRQFFLHDLATALGKPDLHWKGPSWSCFYHATLNHRPIALITARGHRPETVRQGVSLMVELKVLPHEPNYLGIFPVSNVKIRRELGDGELTMTVAALKKAAIRTAVERAIELYGNSPYHRFGMSDDDPHNIELIVEEMKSLKTKYPEMSFFVIETQAGHFVKWEVYHNRAEATLCGKGNDIEIVEQLTLLPP